MPRLKRYAYHKFMNEHINVFSYFENRKKGMRMLMKEFDVKKNTAESEFNQFAYEQTQKRKRKLDKEKEEYRKQFESISEPLNYNLLLKNDRYLIPDKVIDLGNGKIQLIFKSKM